MWAEYNTLKNKKAVTTISAAEQAISEFKAAQKLVIPFALKIAAVAKGKAAIFTVEEEEILQGVAPKIEAFISASAAFTAEELAANATSLANAKGLAKVAESVAKILKYILKPKSVGKNAENKMENVQIVQDLLKQKKYYTGAIDGKCGEKTIEAITVFQQKAFGKSLPSGEIIGFLIVGVSQTWFALNSQFDINTLNEKAGQTHCKTLDRLYNKLNPSQTGWSIQTTNAHGSFTTSGKWQYNQETKKLDFIDTKIIYINDQIPIEQALTQMSWEMTNATNHDKFKALDVQALNNTISEVDYIKSINYLEAEAQLNSMQTPEKLKVLSTSTQFSAADKKLYLDLKAKKITAEDFYKYVATEHYNNGIVTDPEEGIIPARKAYGKQYQKIKKIGEDAKK